MMIIMNNAAAAAASSSVAASLEQHSPSTVANLQVVSAPSPSSSLPAPSNPRKKRTKLIRMENPLAVVKRKPDPDAPKITRPCSECGKKFWSWKALFGHMRCHPERQWRGINPPPNFRNRLPEEEEEGIRYLSVDAAGGRVTIMTEDDHEVAACLLMLANSPSPSPAAASFCAAPIPTITIGEDDSGEGLTVAAVNVGIPYGSNNTDGDHNCRFECSCCRKVFTSHQALGGHRASHRNVKGCFAITTSTSKNDGDPDGDFNDEFNGAVLMELTRGGSDNHRNALIAGYSHHKCGICSRVFSSGQALGGHKRCHWEKTTNNEFHHQLPLTPSSSSSSTAPPPLPPLPSSYRQQPAGDGGVDLNSPATLESSPSVCQDCHHGLISVPNSYYTTCSLSSSPALDLRLGL